VTGTTAAEIVVADIAARLRPACSHLADADFAALVLDLVRMKIRLATIDDRWVQETNGVVPPVDGCAPTRVRIELPAGCINVDRSHDALELLRARYHAALGGDPSRVALDRLIDTQHR